MQNAPQSSLIAEVFQSTPDQKAGRCRPTHGDQDMTMLFQSTPDQKAGRCQHHGQADPQPEHGFNPRPTRRPGDALLPTVVIPAGRLFQSTPDQKAGRCAERTVGKIKGSKFQSTPDQKAGRCGSRGIYRPSGSSFNPRPTRRPGDAIVLGLLDIPLIVFQSTPDQKAGRCRDRGQ